MNLPSGPVRAALVTVGDELLLGRTVDTNAAWLGRRLADLGVPQVRRHTVADRAQEIHHAISDALEVADVVLVTGGLGPTPDDLTRDAVAELLGRPLHVDEAVLEDIRQRFLRRGVAELPEPNRRVAQVPEGAIKLANPVGTAPGLAMDAGDGRWVVLLPGVPREMKAIVDEGLVAFLTARFGDRLRPVYTRTLHTTGIPESMLSKRIAEALPDGPPVGLAFLPDETGVDLRLTAMDMDAAEAERLFDAVEDTLADLLWPYRFEAPEGDLVEAVTSALLQRGKTVALAESCTGGLVAKRMTDRAGASQVMLGGVVAYDDSVKRGVLGVDSGDLAAHGAVSGPVARQMALGVARALGADAGVGITGVAGPDGGTEEKPVGTVWYAAALDGRVVTRLGHFPGDRHSVRERSAQAALLLLLRLLEGRAEPDGDTRG